MCDQIYTAKLGPLPYLEKKELVYKNQKSLWTEHIAIATSVAYVSGSSRNKIIGPVWYNSQQLRELLYTYFQNSFISEAIFLLLSQRHELG